MIHVYVVDFLGVVVTIAIIIIIIIKYDDDHYSSIIIILNCHQLSVINYLDKNKNYSN